MCGRFATRSKSWPEIFTAMDLTATRDRQGEVRANFNLGPMQKAPIIASDGSKIRAVTATWSLIPTWWKQDLEEKKFSTFNAKSETITTTKSFSGPIKSLRCLVPAHAYYEWKREGKIKQGAFAIGMNDQSMFAMAGIWTYWKGTYKQKDWEGFSFSILTCKPNPLTADVHHRMPVILHKDSYEDWLHAPVEQALNLASPYPSQNMAVWEVDGRVGKLSENDEGLLAPKAEEKPGDETGLLL
tara:strand:- start:4152 stop:4877 length:726 start_codon:yes stop_codon:yes gene_type:complete